MEIVLWRNSVNFFVLMGIFIIIELFFGDINFMVDEINLMDDF